MKRKQKITAPVVAVIGVLLMIAVSVLGFVLSSTFYRSGDAEIILPSELASAPVLSSTNQENKRKLEKITITEDNVQQVVASLSRPASYWYTVRSILRLNETSQTLTCRRYVLDGASRIDDMDAAGAVERTVITYDNKLYAWAAGDTGYYEGVAGDFDGDEMAMLPDYQTVCDLDPASITDAGLQNLNYEPCIRVSATEGALSATYYISAVSGLLKQADVMKDNVTVRQITLTNLSVSEPSRTYFKLPDGKSLFEVMG